MGILARLMRRHDGRPLTRMDSWAQGSPAPGGRWINTRSGMGGPMDRSQYDLYVAGDPIDEWTADALLETNALARRIASREPEDCTREGYDLEGLDPGLAADLEAAIEGGDRGRGLGLLDTLAEARTWARAYGGGAVVMLIDDGRDPHEPVDLANIRAIRGVLSATRYELTVQQWGSDTKEPRTFGRPRLYRLQLNRGGTVGQIMTVHADRVVRVRGMPLPRKLMLRRDGWDGSVFDLVYAALRAYGATHIQTVEAVTKLNQGVLTSPALTDALETEDGQVFQQRLEAFAQAMGTYGEAAIGQEETYQIHNRSLSGIGDAVRAARDALVAAADEMPRLVLLGEPTAGLGDTTGGELRLWYDVCASRQPRYYTPAVEAVVDLVMLSHEGPTGGRRHPYRVVWRPLWQMDEAERAGLELQQAQRRMTDIQSSTVSVPEARTDKGLADLYELRRATEPMVEPGPGDEPLGETVEGTPVAEAALNGAQIKSLVEIVQAVALGELPRDSAMGIIGASFPLLRGREAEVLGSAEDPGAGILGDLTSAPIEGQDDASLVQALPSIEPPPPDLMSPRDAGEMFGVPTATISRLIAKGPEDGGLAYWGLGKHKRVSAAAVAELAKSHERGDGLPYSARQLETVQRSDPFAGFETFEACVTAQRKRGESEESARAICGALQAAEEG